MTTSRPSIDRSTWLTLLATLLLAACSSPTTAIPLPLSEDQPTFLYFYTDG
ncbi:MAG: hypothetical protein AAF125_00060 [Chloroflexota bacterium]